MIVIERSLKEAYYPCTNKAARQQRGISAMIIRIRSLFNEMSKSQISGQCFGTRSVETSHSPPRLCASDYTELKYIRITPSSHAATPVSGTPTLGLYQHSALRAAAAGVVPPHDSCGFSVRDEQGACRAALNTKGHRQSSRHSVRGGRYKQHSEA